MVQLRHQRTCNPQHSTHLCHISMPNPPIYQLLSRSESVDAIVQAWISIAVIMHSLSLVSFEANEELGKDQLSYRSQEIFIITPYPLFGMGGAVKLDIPRRVSRLSISSTPSASTHPEPDCMEPGSQEQDIDVSSAS
ncbi:hypothetical protein CFOL_v3_33192, partial [Cephalotus follicularis]